MLGSTNMNSLIDMNYFNNALVMGGGNEIISNKKHIISMRKFIKILLKLFKKDFEKKKLYSYQSGGSSAVDEYAQAYNFSDLNYSNPYPFPLAAAVDRSFT
jgi:hypothetical protein